jgi:hypothetical protein
LHWAERKSRSVEENWAAGEVGLKREEERVGVWGFSFFSKSLTLFKPFSTFQNILKTFKTSHKQTINTMQPKDDAQALIASKIIQNDI